MGVIDFSAHYTIAGYGAVAWYVTGYATQWTEESWDLECTDPKHHTDDDHYNDSGYLLHPECWLYNEPEEVEVTDYVTCVMVGDDREETFDVRDLTIIPEDGYCRECGQIGCGSSVYE